MIEGQAGALLEALTVLVRFLTPARAMPARRKALAELIIVEAPDMTTPLTPWRKPAAPDASLPPARAACCPSSTCQAHDARASAQKLRPPSGRRQAKGKNEVCEWLDLRQAVATEQRRRGIGHGRPRRRYDRLRGQLDREHDEKAQPAFGADAEQVSAPFRRWRPWQWGRGARGPGSTGPAEPQGLASLGRGRAGIKGNFPIIPRRPWRTCA